MGSFVHSLAAMAVLVVCEDDWAVSLVLDLVGIGIEVGEIQLPLTFELLDFVLGSVDRQLHLVRCPAINLLYVFSHLAAVAFAVGESYVLELVAERAKDEDIGELLGSGLVVVYPFLVSFNGVLKALLLAVSSAYLTLEALAPLGI